MENINIKTCELIIKNQLRSIGYFDIEIQKEKGDSFELIALSKLRDIFLKVLIRISEDNKKVLTSEVINHIKKSATETHKEPWVAIMYVNERGELNRGIKWEDLSKPKTVKVSSMI